jgi:aminoglycoside phosphotransferase (APT) family kinase protein
MPASVRRTPSAAAGATTWLIQEYGGPSTPGLGFALGFERTLLALEAAGVTVPALPRAEVYVARVDDSVTGAAFALAQALRDAGVATELDHQARSLKSQFKQADRLGARLVAVSRAMTSSHPATSRSREHEHDEGVARTARHRRSRGSGGDRLRRVRTDARRRASDTARRRQMLDARYSITLTRGWRVAAR